MKTDDDDNDKKKIRTWNITITAKYKILYRNNICNLRQSIQSHVFKTMEYNELREWINPSYHNDVVKCQSKKTHKINFICSSSTIAAVTKKQRSSQ